MFVCCSRTPVRLCDVVLSPSCQQNGEMDVLVNRRTSLTCVRLLNFAFEESSCLVLQDMTLQDILNDPREYQRVSGPMLFHVCDVCG